MTKRDKQLSLLVKLCSDKAAFEVRPKRRVSFNMNMVLWLLEVAPNYEILVDTPYIIIVRSRGGQEITFSEDGRMLLKKVLSKDEATSLAYDILENVIKASKFR